MLTADRLKKHPAWFEKFDEGYGLTELEETDPVNELTVQVKSASATGVTRFQVWMHELKDYEEKKPGWINIVKSLSEKAARGDLKCVKCRRPFTRPLSAEKDVSSFTVKCEGCKSKHTVPIDDQGKCGEVKLA